jgi:hypothetical protein
VSADIVVTVPKTLWKNWLEEGDLPGDPWGGDYWSYYTGGAVPGRVALTGDKWCAEAFSPHGLEGSPGVELVWSHLANDDRDWHLAAPDQRCYVVAHGRLRGFSPLFALETDETRRELKAFIRKGDAVALTVAEHVPGFRGWRYRWWDRAQEEPFTDWKTRAVLGA